MVKVWYFLKTDQFLNYNPLRVWKCRVTHVWKLPKEYENKDTHQGKSMTRISTFIIFAILKKKLL